MLMLVGRLVRNAVVSTLKDARKVANFDLAINDYYKPKNGEAKKRLSIFPVLIGLAPGLQNNCKREVLFKSTAGCMQMPILDKMEKQKV